MSFGERLRKTRIAKGMTEAALAKKAGVDYRTVQYLENSPDKLPNGNTLKSLATVLEVSADYLLGLRGE